MVSSLTRHLYRHCRVTPSSSANSLTSSQLLRRSTAIRWNFREYRFRFTLQPFPCKVCPSWLSHFKGAVHCSRFSRLHPFSETVLNGHQPVISTLARRAEAHFNKGGKLLRKSLTHLAAS